MADLSFHTVVIGGGPGGVKAAKVLAAAGKKVALVSDDLGGECLNFGCIPTKTYLWTADLFEKMRAAQDMGIDVSGCSLNWGRMKKRRSDIVTKLKKNLRFAVEKAGVSILDGLGTLKGNRTVEFKSADGSTKTIGAEFIVLATGSEAVFPPGFELSDRLLSNKEILDLPDIPKTLLIIGAGAVGVEFASLFAALGTQVTIAEANDRLLPHEDSEVSAELSRVFARNTITVQTQTRIAPDKLSAFEKALMAVGRKPAVKNLGLENAGVQAEPKGITTNEEQRTNVPNIFAIGDSAGKALLAYTAEREGEIAARTILGTKATPLRYDAVPNTIFSMPEVASVGLTEEEAKKRGIEYIKGKALMSANAKALIMGSRDGFAKIIADKKTHALLGIHIIGEKVSELIGEASLALVHNLTLEAFAANLHSHPILDESLKDACEAALYGEAIK